MVACSKPISDVGLFAVYASNCCRENVLPNEHLASCAECYQVKGRLAQIDANRTYLHIDMSMMPLVTSCIYDPLLPQDDQAADHLISC